MSSEQYDFNTPAKYSYPSTIVVEDGIAKLALQDLPGQTYTQTYDSDTGFTYDATKAIFSGTQLEQLSQGPVNSSAFANYETDENLNWGDSSLSGTLAGGAVISNGFLDMTAGGTSSATYVITGAINAMKGAIRILWVPNYTGNPTFNKPFFEIADSSGSANNKLVFRHDTASAIRMDSYTNVGVGSVGTPFGTISVVAGTAYIMEFNWDFTPGAEKHEVYIDGVQQGGTQATVKTRDDNLTSITYLQLAGVTSAVASNSDSKYRYVLVATEPLNTAAHTAPTEPPALRYTETCTLSPLVTIAGAVDGILQSIEHFVATYIGQCRFTLMIEYPTELWYNTTSNVWEESDGTFSQANTDVELEDHFLTFPFCPTSNDFQFCTKFPESANTKSSISNLAMEYTSEGYPTTNPVISIVNAERIWMQESLTFAAAVTLTGSDLIKFMQVLGGTKTWYNTTWQASNNSYAETNTLTEVVDNFNTLVSSRLEWGLDIWLHSEDGLTTPTIDLVALTFDAALPNPTNLPRLVDINGYIYNHNSAETSGTIKIRPYQHGFNNPNDGEGGGVFQLYAFRTLATILPDGFFSGSAYMQPNGEYWQLQIEKQKYILQLEDKDANDINELELEQVDD